MASYNNYFPQNYTQYPNLYGGTAAPAQTYTAPAQNTVISNGINWVQGEAGARSVPVGAGQKILLMDSENNVFYVKSSDASGMPLPLRTFEYKEVSAEVETNTAPAQSTYVTKEELNEAISNLKKSLTKEEKKNEQFSI